MTDLSFITDEQLRNLVERDKRELENAIKYKLEKSPLLLAGSIIEAILCDFFLAYPHERLPSRNVLSAPLSELIDLAHTEGLISERSKQLATVIRNYRNLIHPGREYRLKEKVDVHAARVAYNLVEMVIGEISENYARRQGYTSDQAINKVKIDPNCTAIFPHIIDKMTPIEMIKLFKAIPDICYGDAEIVDSAVEGFIKLHHLLKSRVPDFVVLAEVDKVYDYIQNRSQTEAMFYLRFFCNNLTQLEENKRVAVVTYLFGILEAEHDVDILDRYARWGIYSSIGSVIKNEMGVKRIGSLIHEIARTYDNKLKDARTRILSQMVYIFGFDQIEVIVEEAGFFIDKEKEHWRNYLEEIMVPF